ncbi:Ldh family oxidoreductase [Herbaspirillum sp. LeCh32-8]|uniref:Ldh family oxidoreductase n=1 Tax=Herbaspirillum sp. LeCh32-8 TaxID=2821356 RepID=UPI001AE85B00|nr:Ldh family oxidoreductase [Herbaspirillum sp. LeCh32-8]MBP0597503.1 Ldh family oxidoreductase [Herbaspirillum sp. LeCh32-8]
MVSNGTVQLSLAEVFQLSVDTLTCHGLALAHAESIARVITAGQRDECHSHGLYRLISCVDAMRRGKVALDAVPEVEEVSPAITRVDAKFGFSQLAFDRGVGSLINKAQVIGIAALAVNNCYHFSALWPEVERIAGAGLVGLAMTPSHSWVAPAGGTKPVYGTNPIAFAWPRPGRHPYVFDFATSATARGEIELHRRAGKKIPPGWALDAQGNPTEDAEAALAGTMLTFGGHKGSALSAMIELMGGALIGDMLSADSYRFDDGAKVTPCHGELLLAFSPQLLGGVGAAAGADRAEAMFGSIGAQGARLPSQRRFEARERSEAHGVVVPAALYADILALSAR